MMRRQTGVDGGVRVRHGERRPYQPFLVGFDYGDLAMVWTDDPEEAKAHFLIQVRRILKRHNTTY